jgi:hypothetical protein
MFDLECPACLQNIDVEGEDLPDNACDDAHFECPYCYLEMKIGWRAEVEVRSCTVEYGETVQED